MKSYGYRMPRKDGLLSTLYAVINDNLPDDEKVESLGCVPKKECGDCTIASVSVEIR